MFSPDAAAEDARVRANCAADLLFVSILESEVIENCVAAYNEACQGPLADSGVKAKEMGEEEKKRILFEIACIGAYLVMMQEAPGQLLLNFKVDTDKGTLEGTDFFNYHFHQRILDLLGTEDFKTVRQVIPVEFLPKIKTGLGSPLSAVERLGLYEKLEGPAQAVEEFRKHLALAVDVKAYLALEFIAMHMVEPIVDLVRLVLSTALNKAHDHDRLREEVARLLASSQSDICQATLRRIAEGRW